MSLPATYRAAERFAGGCPIEAGVLGALADHECAHGSLPTDKRIDCSCWAVALPAPSDTCVRARRQALGLTTRQLAYAAGVSHTTIVKIELHRREPQPGTRIAIERALREWDVHPVRGYAARAA